MFKCFMEDQNDCEGYKTILQIVGGVFGVALILVGIITLINRRSQRKIN